MRECGKADRGWSEDVMRHDQSYKAMFSDPRMVKDLVRGFVAELLKDGEKWVARLDFSTLEPLPTERIDPTLRGRSNDRCWRVRFRDAADGSEWLRVLLMLEFQPRVDRGMPLRVQGYGLRLYESRRQGERPRRADQVPSVLAVAVYNGTVAWKVPQTPAGLAGKGSRPEAGAKTEARANRPTFTGERRELIETGTCNLDGLPEGNLVSMVVAPPGEARAVLEGALRLLSAADRPSLRDTFLGWFRRRVARTGVDLEFLEDPEMMERIEESGSLRTTLEQRFQALRDADVAKGEERGLEQGLERQRQLLVHLAGRKFGPDVADPVSGRLAGISDPDRLQDVGDWIIDCRTGSELLARLREIG